MMKKLFKAGLLIALVVMLGSCMASTSLVEGEQPAGFLRGIWHGWIAPIALIVQLFRPDTTIFEPNNTGFWYEFGFYMAIISGFGGIGLARGKKRRDRSD